MTRHMGQIRMMCAHAKVNLMLRILAREASGYHSIETVFQKLALCDYVRVQADVTERSLTCDGPAMPTSGLGAPSENLAWKAAELYMRESGWDTGWSIAIEKHIPVGGGLGGGSADAAAVMTALEAMSPTPFGQSALLEYAATLGADVAFFVSGASLALAWGRGDRLLELPALPRVPVTLYAFANGINTGTAYATVAQQRTISGRGTPAHAYSSDAFASWLRVSMIAENDFEAVVPAMHAGVSALLPSIRTAAARSRAEGTAAIGMMSGSGATCFTIGVNDAVISSDAGARVVQTTTV